MGTTKRLHEWFQTLAGMANRGALPLKLHAHVLQFLEAPDGDKSARLRPKSGSRSSRRNKCSVFSKKVEVPGKDVCGRCEASRADGSSLRVEELESHHNQ